MCRKKLLSTFLLNIQKRYYADSNPKHLTCFKYWTVSMLKDILLSAINLKKSLQDTHCKTLDTLSGCKVSMLVEVNEPVLVMAVAKGASLLGARHDVIKDRVNWEADYMGKIFSYMTDAIFVSTNTHGCLLRFADQATVPVMCMKSRTHSSIHALSTVMAIQEEFGDLKGINVAYFGRPDPVLNSYLLLCPMLEANIKFKCSCDKEPVSPLLYKTSCKMCEEHHTEMKVACSKDEVLENTKVVIAGPTPSEEKIDVFKLNLEDITNSERIFFHTCPKGKEVQDELFYHESSRTFNAFQNMQFVVAALLANSIKGKLF